MKTMSKLITGDKRIWFVVLVLFMYSFFLAYSAGTEHTLSDNGIQIKMLIMKNLRIFLGGILVMYAAHLINIKKLMRLSFLRFALQIMIVLLGLVLVQDNGYAAKRWLVLFGFSFQPSTLAIPIMMFYISTYCAKYYDKPLEFYESIRALWSYIIIITVLIGLQNLSTAILFVMLSFILLFIGGYPFKHYMRIVSIFAVLMGGFLFVLMTAPEILPTDRAVTWKNRIETYLNPESASKDATHQISLSKLAVARGGIFGKGPGNSLVKNKISQGTSDFAYAILVEEFGILLGGILILFAYLYLGYLIFVNCFQAKTIYKQLLIVGLGIPVVLQAILNMGVATGLLPVTGQPLPFISDGGTGTLVNCVSIGLVIGMSRDRMKTKKAKITKQEFSKIKFV